MPLFAQSHLWFSVLSVKEIVRDIEQHQCLRALCLEGNSVGVEAARAIAKALEDKDLLQVHLSLRFRVTVSGCAGSALFTYCESCAIQVTIVFEGVSLL